MEQYGISKLDLKRRNRMQILKQLQQQGPTSRIDLSSTLELTRAAVTIITNDMISQGVLYEKGEVNTQGQKASRGRKKILIDINENHKFAFGVAIDNAKIYIGLSNIGGQVLEKRVQEIHAAVDTQETILRQLFKNMRDMLSNSCLEESQILGIGVCTNRRALRFLNLKEIDNVVDYSPLQKAFEREFSVPVLFDSIISGIAAAEMDFSKKLPADENIIMIRFSDNIDAVMVVNNDIYRGYHNRAMDLAHLRIHPESGAQCHCGKKGCALTEFSDESLYVSIVNIFSKENTPKLYEKMNGNANLLRVADVHEYLCLGDAGIEGMFQKRLDSLNIFINNLVQIADPQRIVFFGAQFENEEFLHKVKESVAENIDEEVAKLIGSSYLRQENIYLSGCALAVRKFFIERGGFDPKK